MAKFRLEQQAPVSSYTRSVHGIALAEKKSSAAVCTDCHGSHDLHKGTNPASKLFWQNIPGTCGKCHENVKQTYLRSVHGQAAVAGKRESPVCTNCHGEHTITAVKLATSKVFPSHITETCGQCHSAEHITTRYSLPTQVVQTYLQSFHGLALQFGELTVANCDSCHGAHDILPAQDPRSSVNRANLPQTCGKCHPGIGTRLAATSLRVHAPPGAAEGKPWIVNLVVRLYILFIVAVVGGMVLHNALDYFVKVRAHIRQVRAADGEIRLSGWERAQHLTLIVVFVLLVYTGFVHKFPEAFFSWPFRVIPEGSFVRGLIHRISGGVFIVLMVVHLIALLGTRRGRRELWEMMPRPRDVKEVWGTLAYNLGWRASPPDRGRFNYVEKSEYWALLWGSVIMAATGIMLMFTELVLRWLPKVWLDLAQVIHYYEAVLATLAILVWHFYATIFDPHEYPMNPSWLISKKAPFRHKQEAKAPSSPLGHDQKEAVSPSHVAAPGPSVSPDRTEVS
jgi:cytochrome b subunit of formate dehydrogenase